MAISRGLNVKKSLRKIKGGSYQNWNKIQLNIVDVDDDDDDEEEEEEEEDDDDDDDEDNDED